MKTQEVGRGGFWRAEQGGYRVVTFDSDATAAA